MEQQLQQPQRPPDQIDVWAQSQPHVATDEPHWGARIVWLVAGFNLGFIALTLILFVLVPLIVPGVRLNRGGDNGEGEEVALAAVEPAENLRIDYIIVTSPPTATLSPSATPTEFPTETPSEIPTLETVSETPPEVALGGGGGVSEVNAPKPPTYTPAPTDTPWPTATPIPPTATPIPAPQSYSLDGMRFVVQTWNNCGPANLSLGLSYYDVSISQAEIARYLKPNREDKNVSPDQMIAYVNEFTNLRAIYRVAGTIDTLRWLVANHFVVLAESGYQPPGDDWYGHYFTVGGYDDARGVLQLYDTNQGTSARPRIEIAYRDFDRDWQAFNRTYLVIYPPEREAELQAFIGVDWIVNANWNRALSVARDEVDQQRDNAYAWFNLGTALAMTRDYATAARAFDQSFALGLPRRMLWYQFMPYESYYQQGRFDDVVSLAQTSISTTPYVEESYYYLGKVYEVRGDINAAIEEYKLALRYNSNFRPAQEALSRLGA